MENLRNVHLTKALRELAWTGGNLFLKPMQKGALFMPLGFSELIEPPECKGSVNKVWDAPEQSFNVITCGKEINRPKDVPIVCNTGPKEAGQETALQ